jgi:hypothetical protein
MSQSLFSSPREKKEAERYSNYLQLLRQQR